MEGTDSSTSTTAHLIQFSPGRHLKFCSFQKRLYTILKKRSPNPLAWPVVLFALGCEAVDISSPAHLLCSPQSWHLWITLLYFSAAILKSSFILRYQLQMLLAKYRDDIFCSSGLVGNQWSRFRWIMFHKSFPVMPWQCRVTICLYLFNLCSERSNWNPVELVTG